MVLPPGQTPLTAILPSSSRTLARTDPPNCFSGIKGGKYYLIQTIEQFDQMMVLARQQPALAIDTETSGLDWVRAEIAGVVLGWGVEHNYYIPVTHRCS